MVGLNLALSDGCKLEFEEFPRILVVQGRGNMKTVFGVLLFCFLIFSSPALALEPPDKQELEQYRRDGSFAERVANAQALGNHRVSPKLVARLQHKLNRIRLEMQGLTPQEIEIMAPPPAWQGMPTTGNVKILVLLIEFSDYLHQPQNTRESIESKLFGDGSGGTPYESLRNYYRRSSYNQLEITGNVLGWYNTGAPRSGIPMNNTGRQNLIKQALNYYDGLEHDFTQYDNDGDGAIDYLVVIWTGPDNGWSNFWWGYMTNFTDGAYRLDGKRLSTYSWQWEARPYPGTFTPRVVIHETGHALGLPDYYDYDDTVGPDGGVGYLDMMDASWGDHNCFSKFLLDWINPPAYSSGTHVITLNASGTSQDAAVLMPGAVAGNEFGEFFMIQNRHRVGNDPSSYPTDGLLIWHVDSRLSGGDFIYDNSYTPHKLLRLMEADGLEEIETFTAQADAGDYYVSGRTLGPMTFPNSNRYDGTSTEMAVSGISVAGISMSFTVSFISWTSIPEATLSGPAIAWNPVAQKIQMVVRGGGDLIWSTLLNTDGSQYGSWALVPGTTLSAPALAWNPNYPGGARMQVVVRGGGNTIWRGTFNSSGTFMNDWAQIPGAILDAPALAWNPLVNEVQMAVRGLNDTIWASTFDSTGTFMNDWVQIPGTTLSAPALAWNPIAQKILMVVRGGGNSIWRATFNSSGTFMNDWVQIPGAILDAPALAWNPLVTEVQMSVRGGGDSIWAASFNSSGTFNYDWTQVSGYTPSAPAIVYLPSGDVCIVVRGLDNTIWEILF
jgi:M6 family metalloprotease-like protein